MEIDTDCHAWYIHADSTEAAVRCLCDMAGELQGIDSFYVNGDDVTEKSRGRLPPDYAPETAGSQ